MWQLSSKWSGERPLHSRFHFPTLIYESMSPSSSSPPTNYLAFPTQSMEQSWRSELILWSPLTCCYCGLFSSSTISQVCYVICPKDLSSLVLYAYISSFYNSTIVSHFASHRLCKLTTFLSLFLYRCCMNSLIHATYFQCQKHVAALPTTMMLERWGIVHLQIMKHFQYTEFCPNSPTTVTNFQFFTW